MRYIVCVAGIAALLVAGCSEPARETTETPGADTALPAAAAPGAAAASSPHGNVDISTAHGQLAAATLDYKAPEGWTKQPVSNPMRKDQYLLPGQGGAADGELTVFFFPDMEGVVQQNIDRWLRQFEQPGGGSTEKVAKTTTSTVNGMKVTTVRATGIFLKPLSPMMTDTNVQRLPDYALMGSIVETKEGPWFFKAVGPEKTLNHWQGGFDSMIATVKSAE